MGLTEETDSQSPAALVGKQSPWSLKMWGCPTLPRRTWGCHVGFRSLKRRRTAPRGPWGLVQAQVAAGTARGKGPLLDSAKEGLGLRKTWFRTLTHPRPLHPGHPGHDSGCSPHPPSLFSQLQNRG